MSLRNSFKFPDRRPVDIERLRLIFYLGEGEGKDFLVTYEKGQCSPNVSLIGKDVNPL